MSKPRYEVALALLHRDARWLIARRHHSAHLGGLWEFPGGECEPGEHTTTAAIRELREECGVQAVAERALQPVFHEYPDRCVNLTPVICRWLSGEAQPLGSEDCRWVALGELRRLEMPPVNAEIIRRLEQAV
jgi:mutator protein MutT